MKKLLLALLMSPTTALAWQPIVLRELYLVHRTFKEGSRDPVFDNAQLENREIGQELSLYFNSDLFCKHMFWNNHVMSYVARNTESKKPEQFRNVGWEFEVGARPFDWLEVSYYHFSKHMLDAQYVNNPGTKGGRFPVEDALQFKVWFYKKEN